jgi:hypothetical protein
MLTSPRMLSCPPRAPVFSAMRGPDATSPAWTSGAYRHPPTLAVQRYPRRDVGGRSRVEWDRKPASRPPSGNKS